MVSKRWSKASFFYLEIDENFEILWNFGMFWKFMKFLKLKFFFFIIFKFSNFSKVLTEYTSHEVYSLWGRVEKMPIRKMRNSFFFDKWYFDPPTHGILNPLPIVYRPPYPWYIDPLPMVFWPPTHGISIPLSMLFWPAYPWYIDPIPMPRWYIDPLTHGTLTPLSMVFWPPIPMEYWSPYAWYFDLPAYLLIRNGGGQNTMGVQFTIQGGSVFNKGVQYTMDENWPRGQFTMGFKIPHDTGSVPM